MVKRINKWVVALVLLVVSTSALAQLGYNSPYSRFGVGLINTNGQAANLGMGGLGISNGHVFFINDVNPAMLQKTKYTTFEYGLQGQLRNIQTDNISERTGDANLNNISIAFAVGRKWSTGIGLHPYSSRSYTINSSEGLSDGTVANYSYQGSGGLNRVNFTNAYRVYDDTLRNTTISLGLEMKYLFGSLESSASTNFNFEGTDQLITSSFLERGSFNGLAYKPGIAFRTELKGYDVDKSKTYKNQRGDKRDTIVNGLELFIGDALIMTDSLSTVGKYAIFIKGEQGIKIDPSIKSYYERVRIETAYREFGINDVGVFVRKAAEGRSKSELKTDFVSTYKEMLGLGESSDTIQYTLSEIKEYLKTGTGIYFNAGFALDVRSKIGGANLFSVDRTFTDGTVVNSDTLINDNSGSLTLPPAFHFGLSLDKPLALGRKANGDKKQATWTIGTDISLTNWSLYAEDDKTLGYKNTFAAILGGSVTPDYDTYDNRDLSNVRKYFRRVIYRGGFSYSQLPFAVSGERYDEIGINFGVSMPLGAFTVRRTPKYINLAFGYGTIGKSSDTSIREQYYKASLSLTVTDKWFRRTKIGL